MKIDIPLLKAKLKYHQKTYDEIAKSIHMNRDTFARHLRDRNFKVKDVHAMMESIPLTLEEAIEIFFSDA